mgnify:CR=1 FL=1
MEVITRTEIFDFIWSQPMYFAIPLALLFVVFCALIVFGAYCIFVGIFKCAEEVCNIIDVSESVALLLVVLGYIAVFVALTFTNLLS